MEFAKWLRDLDHGRCEYRLGEELGDIIAAVNETGQKGTLSIKLTVKREGMQVLVDCESTPKIPKHPHHGTLFFFDTNDPRKITREDPRQLELKQLAPQVLAGDVLAEMGADDDESN